MTNPLRIVSIAMLVSALALAIVITISFQPGGHVLNTSDPAESEPFYNDPRQGNLFPLEQMFDMLRRQAGSGGFVSVGDLVASVSRRAAPPRYPRPAPLYRHPLHAGR